MICVRVFVLKVATSGLNLFQQHKLKLIFSEQVKSSQVVYLRVQQCKNKQRKKEVFFKPWTMSYCILIVVKTRHS